MATRNEREPSPTRSAIGRPNTLYTWMESGDTMSISGTSRERKRIAGPAPTGLDRKVVVSVYCADTAFIYAILSKIADGYRPRDKEEWVCTIASAIGSLLGTKVNLIGPGDANIEPEHNPPEDANNEAAMNAPCGFVYPPIADVTWSMIAPYSEYDDDEIAAYFGTLMVASCKKATSRNHSAFNTRRVGGATATSISTNIYIENSVYLAMDLLTYNYACWNSLLPARGRLANAVNAILRDQDKVYGPRGSFATQWNLLEDFGMGGLSIVVEGLRTYPWILEVFPYLRAQAQAADAGFRAVRNVEEHRRSFIKVEQGDKFVPAHTNDIKNLIGICRAALARTNPTLTNFGQDSAGIGSLPDSDAELLERAFEERGYSFGGRSVKRDLE